MSRRPTPTALAVSIALLAWAPLARAEPPQSTYTIAVQGKGALRVPSGGSEVCRTSRGVEACLSIPVETNVFGTLGPPQDLDTLAFSLSDTDLTSDLAITALGGVLLGTSARPRAALEFTAAGKITQGSATLAASASGRLRCKPDRAQADSLMCQGKATICAFDQSGANLACTGLGVATRLALVERPFELDLDLATDESRAVTGSAAVVFDEGSLPRTVTGRYDPRSDTATLKLSGLDVGLGSKLALKRVHFEDGEATGGTIVYRISGQKGLVK